MRYPIRDCQCIDWPCCEHADNFPPEPEDCCPYCGYPDCCGDCEQDYYDDEPDDNMSDVEADADTLRSAGFGTDEDYGGGDTPLGDFYDDMGGE